MVRKYPEDSDLVRIVYMNEFAKQWEKTIQRLSKNLKEPMIQDIKTWRVGQGPDDINTHSWRDVAQLFVEKYPAFSTKYKLHAGNQISGMQLCEAAMSCLNETIKDGWN